MFHTDRTCPIVVTMIVVIQHNEACRTIRPSLGTDFLQRMPFGTTLAIPGVRTSFADFVSRLTIFVRTIPLIIAGKIRRMMFETGGTKPVMFAAFIEIEAFIVCLTKAVTAVGALHQSSRMLFGASGTIPMMCTPYIATIDLQAGSAEPLPVAGRIGRMPIDVVCTPPLMGAISLRCINALTTFRIAPTVLVGASVCP